MQTNPLGTCPEISSGTTAALLLLKHNRPGQVRRITGDWRSCAVGWLADRTTAGLFRDGPFIACVMICS
jgi:hypothetical protein